MSKNLFTRGQDLKYPLYVIDGKQYDFSEWIPKHPGGARWFSRANGRDISIAFYGYHKNPEKLQKLLKKYEVKGQTKDKVIDPTLNVPHSLFLRDLMHVKTCQPSISQRRVCSHTYNPNYVLPSGKERFVLRTWHSTLYQSCCSLSMFFLPGQ